MTNALDYAVPADPAPWRRIARFLWRTFLIATVLLVAVSIGYGALTEQRLRRESARLLAANAPAQRWPSVEISFTDDGFVMLPDGQVARVPGLTPRDMPGMPLSDELDDLVSDALLTLRAVDVGYTIVGADESGVPIVEIWALSPRAFTGMCGNSSVSERRQGSMRLWRNVGSYLDWRNMAPFEIPAPVTRISVIGW